MIEPWLGAIILLTVFLVVLAFYAGSLPTVLSGLHAGATGELFAGALRAAAGRTRVGAGRAAVGRRPRRHPRVEGTPSMKRMLNRIRSRRAPSVLGLFVPIAAGLAIALLVYEPKAQNYELYHNHESCLFLKEQGSRCRGARSRAAATQGRRGSSCPTGKSATWSSRRRR